MINTQVNCLLGDKLIMSDNNRKIVYNQCNPLQNQFENILLINAKYIILTIATSRSNTISIEFYYFLTSALVASTTQTTIKSFFLLIIFKFDTKLIWFFFCFLATTETTLSMISHKKNKILILKLLFFLSLR